MDGRITVEQVADDLSLLADSVLRVTAQWCWSRLKTATATRRNSPCWATASSAAKELGYGSDLDIVFVFDDDDERAPRFIRPSCASSSTGSRPRPARATCSRSTPPAPNGNSGLLVTSFQAYADYQQQRGSN